MSALELTFFYNETGESSEAVAGERTYKDADNDISEIVLSDEDAADSYHERPEEHPPSIGFKPLRHG